MDDVERMLIERECERLITAYCHHVDHGEAVRVNELFTDDGVWTAPGIRLEGRDQLRDRFQHRQDQADRTSRHVCLNFLCEVLDADNASGVVYLVLYRHDGGLERGVAPAVAPTMVGEYRDRFERTGDGWRFAERTLVVSFAGSAQ
jgi:ketosteroid isomerase-like protein